MARAPPARFASNEFVLRPPVRRASAGRHLRRKLGFQSSPHHGNSMTAHPEGMSSMWDAGRVTSALSCVKKAQSQGDGWTCRSHFACARQMKLFLRIYDRHEFRSTSRQYDQIFFCFFFLLDIIEPFESAGRIHGRTAFRHGIETAGNCHTEANIGFGPRALMLCSRQFKYGRGNYRRQPTRGFSLLAIRELFRRAATHR